MGFLTESPDWADSVYKIEENDPLHGGEPNEEEGLGQLNWASRHLANRTSWLKAQVEALEAALQNVQGDYVTDSELAAEINSLLNGAPAALDTLRELADALQDNDDELAALVSQMAGKIDLARVQASKTDATADRLLTVGAFGIGETGSPAIIADLDDFGIPNGIWQVLGPTTANIPDDKFRYATAFIGRRAGNNPSVLLVSNNGELATRAASAGAWTSWQFPLLSSQAASQAMAEAGLDNSRYMTALRTRQAINVALDALLDGAPAALDTLRELAEALQDNDDELAVLVSQMAGKLDKPDFSGQEGRLVKVNAGGTALDFTAVMASPTDATAGRIPVNHANGIFGLGATTNPPVIADLLDTSRALSVGRVDQTTLNKPAGVGYALAWYGKLNAADPCIILVDQAGGVIWTRTRYAGVWGDWVKFFSVLDIASPPQAEAGTDNTKVMTPLRTKQAIDVAIAALLDGAPAALDTLRELAEALQDNDYDIGVILSQLATKYDADDKATQVEAEAGTDNAKLMTPLRTKQAILSTPIPSALILDQRANGTDGDTIPANIWTTLELNTEQYNAISGSSLTSSEVTLPAGTYDIQASSVMFKPDYGKMRLVGSLSGTILTSRSVFSSSGSTMGIFEIRGRIALTSQEDVSLEIIASSANRHAGLNTGSQIANDTEPETYTMLDIKKVS